MEHEVYTGTGTYNKSTLAATYNVYLPLLTEGTYLFYTSKIYNFSCAEYPNTILIFMKVKNGPNVDLSGMTSQPGIPVNFSLSNIDIVNVDSRCVPLDTLEDINVIIMHDTQYDIPYAKSKAFCVAPTPINFSAATTVNANVNKGSATQAATLEAPITTATAAAATILYQPKKYKLGQLKPMVTA
ncbi:hypothetical protein [Flavobacterium subsaxonicum]|uniref:Uncharacterized protein n=1 Tax=Flavobacterium subsaxonicum WB 4.1-42 = DSM 21790 TaxID=1121898 RepID=A0A0A2MXU8_9FLAO|nr:hypothetical protein [Flavobacterium subsaxonicum]KGO93045.1 hypothetical protein Q766_10545 [Flavobacterium subsaxonicum WB 4.1-42 = DSM 21790]